MEATQGLEYSPAIGAFVGTPGAAGVGETFLPAYTPPPAPVAPPPPMIQPSMLLLALSMPILAVGAAFNFHAGLLPQAPRLMQDLGLEWLFRLACEPRRLARRYLFHNPRFVWLLAAQLWRERSRRGL